MKKRITSIIAVVLTLALLVSTIAINGLISFAEEKPATEFITINDKKVEILKGQNHSALDEFTAANAAAAEAGEVTFTGSWTAEYRYPWKDYLATPYKITTKGSGYTNIISFYTGNTGYAASGMAIYSNMLYVNPSQDWFGASEAKNYPLTLKWTAPEAGEVVLYDENGNVTTPAVNGPDDPQWAWLAGTANKNTTFTISKNGTVIWPLNGEDNSFTAGGESIAFPDLGKLTVVEGDVISISVVANSVGGREGIIMTPAVAYTYEEPAIPVSPEDVTVGGENYTINANEKYNALSEISGAFAAETYGTQYAAADLPSGANWSFQIARYTNATTDYTYMAGRGDFPTVYGRKQSVNNEWDTSWMQNSLAFGNNVLYVGPSATDGNSWVSLNFTAPHDGEVLLYDLTGKVKAHGKNVSPFWCFYEDREYDVQFTIYQNGTKIWPLNGEDNSISNGNDYIDFPNMLIDVYAGDTITLKFNEPASVGSRAVLECNPQIAYTHYHDANVVETEATFYRPGTKTGTCAVCGETYNESAYKEVKAFIYDKTYNDGKGFKYDPTTDTLSFVVVFSPEFYNDWKWSKDNGYVPDIHLDYTVGEKTYTVKYVEIKSGAQVFEIHGFTPERLNTEATINIWIRWDGSTATNWAAPFQKDTANPNTNNIYVAQGVEIWSHNPEAAVKVKPIDVMDETVPGVTEFGTLNDTVASATPEAIDCGKGTVSGTQFNPGKATVDIVNSSVELKFSATQALKDTLKLLETNWLADEGNTREIDLVVTINGVTFTKKNITLRTNNTVTISGLSYEQLYGEISVKLHLIYRNSNKAWVHEEYTDSVTYSFAAGIDASESDAAQALESYINAVNPNNVFVNQNGQYKLDTLTPVTASEVKTVNGKQVIYHNGNPYLYYGMHFRYNHFNKLVDDATFKKTFEEGVRLTKESGYDTIVLYLHWYEMFDGKNFDFELLEYQYSVAKKYDLKIAWNWFGMDFAGFGGYQTWQLKDLEKYSPLKDSSGNIVYNTNEDKSDVPVPDLSDPDFLNDEVTALNQFLAWLNVNDTERRTVLISLEGEINNSEGGHGHWFSQYDNLIKYMNNLAKAVKEGPYQMVTHTNLMSEGWNKVVEGLDTTGFNPPAADSGETYEQKKNWWAQVKGLIDQPYLDIVSYSNYTDRLDSTIDVIEQGDNLPMLQEFSPALWCVPSQVNTLFKNGYGVAFYQLVLYNETAGKTGGLYRFESKTNPFVERDGTLNVDGIWKDSQYISVPEVVSDDYFNMNKSISAISEVIAKAPIDNIVNFNVNMTKEFSESKTISGSSFSFNSNITGSDLYGATGLLIKSADEANTYYTYSSKAATLFCSRISSISEGSYKDGVWTETASFSGKALEYEAGKAYKIVIQ